jgi:tRNA A-37 threonylcarbamoyl transferase component Bud32
MAMRWVDLPEQLARQLDDLPALVEQGLAVVIKDRPQRTIFRVHLAGHDLHVKQCKVCGWRAWFRERFRAPKAHLEYSKLLAAAARHVSTVTALGCGTGRAESVLVTSTISDAIPLADWLETWHRVRERFAVSIALGQFMARIHHAGVLHPDPHPGNILIRDSAEPKFFLLDLHDARFGPPASERASLANLVLFNRWFILRTNRSDRMRFWRAYVVERTRLANRDVINYFQARDLEWQTSRSNLRFWRGRTRRCVEENRRFRRVAIGRHAGHLVSDWPMDAIDPADDFTCGLVLKDSRSSAVVVRDMAIGGSSRVVVCKHFRRSARACRRAWINGHAFLDCLLPTPRPLAMFRRFRFGLPRDGLLVTEFIPDAINLREAVTDASRRRERVELVARIVRHMHQRGWSHRDLKAANVLLAPDSSGRESARFIDLAGASRPIRLSRGRRAKDLTRLNASFHDLPQLSRTDRLRFLRAYLNWNVHGRGDWKTWWRCIVARTRGKVAKNRRRGRPLA